MAAMVSTTAPVETSGITNGLNSRSNQTKKFSNSNSEQ
jgi:hypothetical protein